MASAEKTTVTREVVKVVEEEQVVLTLSTEEARVLSFILERIGGRPEGTRGVADGLATAMNGAVGWLGHDAYPTESANRAIYFAD